MLTGLNYVRENSLVTQRRYTYDALVCPETRDTRYPNMSLSHHDSFAYNRRSELTGALLDNSAYTYAYDNIGNRKSAEEMQDPIGSEGGVNLYIFNDNCSFDMIDVLGLRIFCCPLDSYHTAEEAAVAAISEWNPVSIQENLEHGGYICECSAWLGLSDPVYYYTHTRGTSISLDLSNVPCDRADKTVADWHTHGAYDPLYDSEKFSDVDIEGNERDNMPGYLETPSGAIKVYYPSGYEK